MRKQGLFLLAALVVVLSVPAFAERILYVVDPATVFPADATVITRGNGMGPTVVVVEVGEISAGMQIVFRMDMSMKGGGEAAYPVTLDMRSRGIEDFECSFDPLQVTFQDPDQTVSVNVTLTIPEGDYTRTARLKAMLGAAVPEDAAVGSGPGVTVFLVVTPPGEIGAGDEGLAGITDLPATRPER